MRTKYNDRMILRDVDLSTAWNAEADSTLETRHYYCQNWRADVSVIIDDSAVLVERIMYSPYGVPFGIPVGDIVSSGGSEPASGTVGGPDTSAITSYLGSSYNIADFDNDGDVDTADQTIQSNNNGASIGWFGLSDVHNRLGYAGYVFDEVLANTKWHVRHRVLESVLGRWISRDPLEYVDGMNQYSTTNSNPVHYSDPSGTRAGIWRAWRLRKLDDCLNFCAILHAAEGFPWPEDPSPQDCNDYLDACYNEAEYRFCVADCYCRDNSFHEPLIDCNATIRRIRKNRRDRCDELFDLCWNSIEWVCITP